MIPLYILAIENEDDRGFIEHIYREYYNLMYNKAYDILHNKDNVDDVINNSCIKLISKIQKLRTFNCCVLASYIVYTTRSVAIDFIRKENISFNRYSFNIDDDTVEETPDDGDGPEELFIEKERIEKLLIALDQLPEKQRMILQYKYFYEMNDKDISEVFDIDTQSVREYLSRARKMLCKILQKESDLYGLK